MMKEVIKINPENLENLETFSEILKKDMNTMFNEALKLYFEHEHQKLLEKGTADENAMTNLNFDEFWDGVEI